MSTKQMMLDAKEFIRLKQYDDAREILIQVDHPVADKWLAKLNQVAPATHEFSDDTDSVWVSQSSNSATNNGFFFQQETQTDALAQTSVQPRKSKKSNYQKQLDKIKIEQDRSPEVATMFGAVGALIGAVIAGVVWAGIAKTTGAEIGYAAIGVGAVTGGAGLTCAGRQGFALGVVCALASVLGIFIGKFGVFYLFLRDSVFVGLPPTDSYVMQEFVEAVKGTSQLIPDVLFSPYDLLWIFLAVGAAWRMSSGLSWRDS